MKMDYEKLNKDLVKWLEGYAGDLSFPDFYAGNKIEKDIITILLVEKLVDKKIINELNEIIPNVKIEYSRHSYNYLLKKYNELNAMKACQGNVFEYYVDIAANCIQVGLLDTSKANEFVDKYNCHQYVNIYQSKGVVQDEYTENPGKLIYVEENNQCGGSTYAYRATDSSHTEGFVTTFHSNNTNANLDVYDDAAHTTEAGKIRIGRYGDSVDACFVDISEAEDIDLTNIAADGIEIVSEQSNFVLNSPVKMLGGISGIKDGQVISMNYTSGGIQNRLLCTYDSEHGDSGSAIVIEANGDYSVIGIHNGSADEGKYGTKISKIIEVLHVNLSGY